MVDQRKMRASDRDRQHVVDQLRSALEDGRLRMDEYMDRMVATAAVCGRAFARLDSGRSADSGARSP